MELLVFILCVTPAIVSAITISPNGNSPEVKMLGGMVVEKGFVPMTTAKPDVTEKSNQDKSTNSDNNSTKLSINERYRRLIPYMTFYYANDINAPPKESYTQNIVEVEKAQIVETPMHRQPKKIHSSYRNIPRYHGNRIIQHPSHGNQFKIYDDVPTYHEPIRSSPHYNPLLIDPHLENQNYRKFVFKPNKAPSAPFSMPTRKPYINIYPGEDRDTRYYLTEKSPAPKYKLVPYEQTPPVKVQQHDVYLPKRPIPVPVLVNKEPVYVKQRPVRPHYVYDNVYVPPARKQPMTVSESYYENLRPQHEIHSAIENGFKPILTNSAPSVTATPLPLYENPEVMVETATAPTPALNRPNYYQYIVDEPAYTQSTVAPNPMSLGTLINSLQINKSIPKPITKDNVGTSIRTLLQVLSALKGAPQNDGDTFAVSTSHPFEDKKEMQQEETKPVVEPTEEPQVEDVEFHQEPYLAPVNPPSQHIDEYPTHSSSGGSSQRFPLHISSDDDGGTPGRPGDDYPILTTIPETKFNCKTQRYKGFFADPETRCQVWHYCDLNGGQASFLCPNGTIFSQAGLTCDWWFNVRCASTPQLYVLNESLYKYILPHSPKFPEDYSGPLVDKYLTLKFKEMEEEFQKNKKSKQSAKSDTYSDEDEGSEEQTTEASEVSEASEADESASEVTTVSEASVFVESSGASGNVQRLQD